MKNTQHDEAQKIHTPRPHDETKTKNWEVTSAHCVVQTFHKVHTVYAVIKCNQPVIYSDIISSYLVVSRNIL